MWRVRPCFKLYPGQVYNMAFSVNLVWLLLCLLNYCQQTFTRKVEDYAIWCVRAWGAGRHVDNVAAASARRLSWVKADRGPQKQQSHHPTHFPVTALLIDVHTVTFQWTFDYSKGPQLAAAASHQYIGWAYNWMAALYSWTQLFHMPSRTACSVSE